MPETAGRANDVANRESGEACAQALRVDHEAIVKIDGFSQSFVKKSGGGHRPGLDSVSRSCAR